MKRKANIAALSAPVEINKPAPKAERPDDVIVPVTVRMTLGNRHRLHELAAQKRTTLQEIFMAGIALWLREERLPKLDV